MRAASVPVCSKSVNARQDRQGKPGEQHGPRCSVKAQPAPDTLSLYRRRTGGVTAAVCVLLTFLLQLKPYGDSKQKF